MLLDPWVRVLSFTGSTEVGRLLLAKAALNVVRCSMELGGNAPFLVLDDAVHDEFLDRFTARTAAVKVGDGLGPGVELGPLVNAATRDKVSDLVDAAVAAGATIATGGSLENRPGYFYGPTVVTGCPPDAAILREEILGPVTPIVRFGDLEEGIDAANATDAGVIAYA